MKIAPIIPTKYLERFSMLGDFYLALAHLIDDEASNDYTRFHMRAKRTGKTVYLDNGLFEGAQVDPHTLIHRAKLINADVVCAPDILYDSKNTIKEFKRFIKLKQEEGLVARVMGIPQADNPVDWWDCFQHMNHSKDCDIIGLSILSIPKAFGGGNSESRSRLIEQLFLTSSISDIRLKKMHLLGLGDSLVDIKAARHYLPREIISNDSSSAFVHGAAGVLFDEAGKLPGGKIKEKLDFDLEYVLTKEQEQNIRTNLIRIKEEAK